MGTEVMRRQSGAVAHRETQFIERAYRQCDVIGCTNTHMARGLCSKHYQKPASAKAQLERRPNSHGKIGGHNKFAMRGISKERLSAMYHALEMSQGEIAAELGVTQGAVHYWMKRYNIPARTKDDGVRLARQQNRFKNSNNPRWAGGKRRTRDGYILQLVPDHPLADSNGYVRQHHLVYHELVGPIPKGFHIHHKNGIKDDNRLENLELMSPEAHAQLIPKLFRRIAVLERENEELRNGVCPRCSPRA